MPMRDWRNFAKVMPNNATEEETEEDSIPRKVERESEAHSEAAMKYFWVMHMKFLMKRTKC